MERNRGGRPRHPDILTPAEWRVLEELREGGTNAEIAVRLGVSPDAVKYHISNMLGKLGLDDGHRLATWRPEEQKRRLLGLLAVPAALTFIGRPLLWGAVVLGAFAVSGATVVLLVVVFGDRDKERLVVAPDARGTPTASAGTPEPRPQPTAPPPAPSLYVISRGAPDTLLLEWTGGPEGTTVWQYRKRAWTDAEPGLWDDWADIPGGLAVERRYEVTGLSPGLRYDFELLAVVGQVASAPSAIGEGRTYHPGSIPFMAAGHIVEGDGSTQWFVNDLEMVITIPDGMRLTYETGLGGRVVRDVASGASVQFAERALEAIGNFPAAADKPERDIRALLGQIVDSRWAAVPACVSGVTVTNAAESRGLVEDCGHLLALLDTLAGTGTLNWSAHSAMMSWTGVTIEGTPPRVTKLDLANSGLTGELLGWLGDLTALTELRLEGNSLTGRVPSKLAQLADLTHVSLDGNRLTGCLPPLDIHEQYSTLGTPVLEGGRTYIYRRGWRALIFDVPDGLRFPDGFEEWIVEPPEGWLYGTTTIALFSDPVAGASLRLDLDTGESYHRGLLHPLSNKLAASFWLSDEPGNVTCKLVTGSSVP